MKLEYFHDACDGRGLLLLYGGRPSEVHSLRAIVRGLKVTGTTSRLHELDFVEAVARCQLVATSELRGEGVRRASGDAFRWSLSPSEWEDTHGLLEPFCSATAPEAGPHFQYLNRHEGPQVIYSTARAW